MSFSVKFNLEIEWYDKNMDWQNLNDDMFLNIVSKDVVDKLWVPHIIFKNTEKNCHNPNSTSTQLKSLKLGSWDEQQQQQQ